MVSVVVDVTAIANEVTRIHNELHETYNMTDTQRRDAVNRIVEKVRQLKTSLENKNITASLR